MKRLLALALVTAGLTAGLAPAAQAAPYCGPIVGVRCTPDGSRFCQVWIAATRTCVGL